MNGDQMELFGEDEPEQHDEETTVQHQNPGEPDEVEPQPQVDLGRFPFPDTLGRHLSEMGLSRGRIRLAADLAGLEPGIDDRQRNALFMAVIVGLEAHSQGSTFVPLPPSDPYFEQRVRALIPEQLVETDETWSPEKIVRRIEEFPDQQLRLVGRPGEFRPLIIEQGRLYHQRALLWETRLVEAVAARLERPDVPRKPERLGEAIEDVRRRQPPGPGGDPIRLNPEQQYAMLTALHRPMTLITGGPGTGKTSIVVSILRTLVRMGVAPGAIALSAPTGKAANRMAESIYDNLSRLEDPAGEDRMLAEQLESPRTLHRLLDYSPRRDAFGHHAHNPLPHRMVVVDESSMIDLFLMGRLLEAISPKAQLVLLGDADQLPSVDTGAVLRDLIPPVVSTDAPWRRLVEGSLPERRGEAPTADVAVRLEESYRMRPEDPAGREILTFARAIRDGEAAGRLELPDPFAPFDEQGEPVDFPEGVRLIEPQQLDADTTGMLAEFVDWWFDRMVLQGGDAGWKRRFNHLHQFDSEQRPTEESATRIRGLLAHWGRARILTLTRVFQTGSEQINAALHRQMARLGRGRQQGNYDFHPGEPVMMLRNDYDRDLFNGDIGVVVWGQRADEEESDRPVAMAVFERTDGLVAYPVRQLGDDLEHAFAMTVHKAQGSQFERVAVVLPSEPMALLNRELLYTGLTRASRGVLVVGRGNLLREGAATHSERFSAVGERLAAECPS